MLLHGVARHEVAVGAALQQQWPCCIDVWGAVAGSDAFVALPAANVPAEAGVGAAFVGPPAAARAADAAVALVPRSGFGLGT